MLERDLTLSGPEITLGAALAYLGLVAVRSIYLDYAATTPLAPAVQEAMLPYLADRFADPTAEHPPGRAVSEAIEDARTRVAAVLAAQTEEIVWTSGSTESSNLALRGLIEPELRDGKTPHLCVSAVDHAAVQGPARFLQRCGAEMTVLPVDRDGRVDPQSVADALRPNTCLVSVVHADDQLGAVQELAEISAICRPEGVLLHTDAAQTLGKESLDVESLGVDLMSLSAHKAYGPKGVGALYIRHGVRLEPQIWGDGKELGQRGGTPNVSGVVGFGAAATLADAARGEANARLADLRQQFTAAIQSECPEAVVYGPEGGGRLAGTVCVAFPSVGASDLLTAAPEICATPCAGSLGDYAAVSPSLRAIGADANPACGAIRVSLGWYTEPDEVENAAGALVTAWENLRV